MRISIVVPQDPPGKNNFHQVPIGSLYTASCLQRAGEDVSFHDLRSGICDDPEGEYPEIAASDLAVVVSNDYDLAQCYPSLAPTAACVSSLRKNGARRVAVAGSHGTAEPELTRAFTGADCVVRGEFEIALPALVASLTESMSLPTSWPATDPATASPEELASLPMPAYDLAPMHLYASEGFVDGSLSRVRSGLVLGNRGCPFGCNFCYLLFGRRLRRRPVDATLTEMTELRDRYGIEHFFFLDYTFTLDDMWVRELCDGIGRRSLDCSWVCQTRVDCLNDETLRQMAEAGCAGIWLGIESPELEPRRYLSKGRIEVAAIQDGIDLIRSHGIEVLAFVIVGVPDESPETLRNLNDWLEATQVMYSLSVFQRRLGTPLSDEAKPEDLPDLGWAYLDKENEHLGESSLRIADLDWFFAYHDSSPRRVANAMRAQMEGV